MALEVEEIGPGGPILCYAVCNSCNVHGATAEGFEEALAGFHPIHELTHILCDHCFRNEVPSSTVRDLIGDMTLRLGAEDIDLRPGSILRVLVEASAQVMEGNNVLSVDLATAQVVGELQTQLGSALDLSPGTDTHNLVGQVVQSAVAERQAAVNSSLIEALVSTPEGRSRLAQAMIRPLQNRMSYGGLVRGAFSVQQLPDGALPYYDRDPGVVAMVVPEPIPDWAFVGAWVSPVTTEEWGLMVCRIVEIADDFAVLQGLNMTIRVDRIEGKLLQEWKPCEPPLPAPSRYERLSQGAELV